MQFMLIAAEASTLRGVLLKMLTCIVVSAAATSLASSHVPSQSFTTSEGFHISHPDPHAKLLRREARLHHGELLHRLPDVIAVRNTSSKRLPKRHSLISEAGDASSLPWVHMEDLERPALQKKQWEISAQLPIATEPLLPMATQVDPATAHSAPPSATEPPSVQQGAAPVTAEMPAAVTPPTTLGPGVASAPQGSINSGTSARQKYDQYVPNAGEHRISKTSLAIIIGFFASWGLWLARGYAKSMLGSVQNKLQREEEEKSEKGQQPPIGSTSERNTRRGGILAELDSGSQTPRRPSQHPRASDVPVSQLTSSRKTHRSVPAPGRTSTAEASRATRAIGSSGRPSFADISDGLQRDGHLRDAPDAPSFHATLNDPQDADAAGGIPFGSTEQAPKSKIDTRAARERSA